MNVGFISLGCSKNLIDTETIIGKFKNNKFTIVNDEKKADIIVINTCGFIDSAKEEAINTILEMAEYKKEKCKYLIVMGCLVQRYYKELQKALPEVDLFIKLDEYNIFWDKVESLVKRGVVEKSKTTIVSKSLLGRGLYFSNVSFVFSVGTHRVPVSHLNIFPDLLFIKGKNASQILAWRDVGHIGSAGVVGMLGIGVEIHHHKLSRPHGGCKINGEIVVIHSVDIIVFPDHMHGKYRVYRGRSDHIILQQPFGNASP